MPLSNLAAAPPVSGRFWADMEDPSSEAGGSGPPDCGPGSTQEDEAEARERVMLRWAQAPAPEVLGACWPKVEQLALDHQRRQNPAGVRGVLTYQNQLPTGSAGFPDNVEVNPNGIVPEPAPGQPYRECRTCKARNTVVGRHCRLCLRDLSGSVVTKGQSGRAAAGSALNSVRGP